MDIFLVRHGEAAASWEKAMDPGLSELGHDQAAATAAQLHSQVDAGVRLISSPLLRAQETAAALAKLQGGAPVEIDATFSEVPSPVAFEERQDWLRAFMSQVWSEQPDSLHEWRSQILDTLLAQQEPVVVFSHFLALNAVVGCLQNREEILCFAPGNAGVVHLRHTGEALELVDLGKQINTFVN